MQSSAPLGFSRMKAGRGRVPGGVAAGLEGGADAAGGEASRRRARPGSAPCRRTRRAPCPRRSACRSCRASRPSSRSAAGTSGCSGSRRSPAPIPSWPARPRRPAWCRAARRGPASAASRWNTSLGRRWRWTAGREHVRRRRPGCRRAVRSGAPSAASVGCPLRCEDVLLTDARHAFVFLPVVRLGPSRGALLGERPRETQRGSVGDRRQEVMIPMSKPARDRLPSAKGGISRVSPLIPV